MGANLHPNGTGPSLTEFKNGNVARPQSLVVERHSADNHLNGDYDGDMRLFDATVTDNDDFVLLSPRQTTTPIAICGMAMRLPGGVSSDADFWRLLMDKKDACCQVPADRYNAAAFQRSSDKSGRIQTTRGYFLDHLDLAHFDASFFSMTRSELEKLDPQHRLLLELTRECLENAAVTQWRGKDIGCYIGSFGEDWLQIQTRDTLESTSSRITGYGDYLLANKVSYEYDFKGPRCDCFCSQCHAPDIVIFS